VDIERRVQKLKAQEMSVDTLCQDIENIEKGQSSRWTNPQTWLRSRLQSEHVWNWSRRSAALLLHPTLQNYLVRKWFCISWTWPWPIHIWCITSEVEPTHKCGSRCRLSAHCWPVKTVTRRPLLTHTQHQWLDRSSTTSEWVSSFLTAHQHIIGHFSAITWY